jgi:hypothetical protein
LYSFQQYRLDSSQCQGISDGYRDILSLYACFKGEKQPTLSGCSRWDK